LLSGLLGSVVTSRSLAPEGRGQYVSWQTLASTIAIIALMGLPQALVLHESEKDALGRISALVSLFVFLAPASVIVLLVATKESNSGWVLVGMVAVVVSTGFGALNGAMEQRRGRLGWQYSVARTVVPMSGMIVILMLSFSQIRSPVTWLVVVSSVQVFAGFLWLSLSLRGVVGERLELVGLIQLSGTLGPAIWATVLQTRLDLLTVIALYDARFVAFYSIGLAAQAVVIAFGSSSTQQWFSRQRGVNRDEPIPVSREIGRILGLSALIAVPLAISAYWWVPLFYGADFRSAFLLVAVLSIVGIAASLDFFAGHEALLRGSRQRLALLRLPSVMFLLGTGLFLYWTRFPPVVMAIAAGLSFVLSASLLLRTRNSHSVFK